MRPDLGFQYDLRNAYLKDLGYRTYHEYLKSDDWKRIRNAIMATKRQCILCESDAQVLHHIRYDFAALLGLRPYVLAPLCHKCHEGVEFTVKTKNSLGEANNKLFTGARKTKAGQAWIQSYHAGLKTEKASGQRVKIGQMCNKIAQELKPWRKTSQEPPQEGIRGSARGGYPARGASPRDRGRGKDVPANHPSGTARNLPRGETAGSKAATRLP